MRRALMSMLVLAGLACVAHAEIIYQDNFDGSGALNGTTPDIGANNWVAASTYGADGAIFNPASGMPPAGWAGTATLAFTPVDGLVYTLDATLTGVSGDGNWLGMGFATGQSTSADPTFNRFLDHDTVGRTWMIVRGGLTNNSAFMDSNSSNIVWDSGTAGGDFDLRVVLDTTGGTGNWTATWYAKRPADGAYTEVRGATTLVNEGITSVGLTKSNTGVTGNVASFSLTSVPEPASLTLLGLGGLLIASRRRA